jgi:hypothetical protein
VPESSAPAPWRADVGVAPVFVVGMPRSGTKLLRELLNGHSGISIPPVETHFLPYWAERWSDYGDLSDRAAFGRFYDQALSLPYFDDVVAIDEPLISAEEWYERCTRFTIDGVYEALMRHAAGVEDGSDVIWGDKTPEYLINVDLLMALFPGARVVHIVRDARDQALSAHRTWGKNMLRSAQRWADEIGEFRRQATAYPGSVAEVRFEDLLDDPERELGALCRFLGVEFERAMLRVPGQAEPTGAARGATEVVKDNQRKYRFSVEPSLRRRIEQIALPMLTAYGYPVSPEISPRRIGRSRQHWFRLKDGASLLRSEAREKGAVKGAGFLFKSVRSNRTRVR